jgi:imidazolonepropionase
MMELRIIVDGALLIQDGVITEVGTTRRVERLALARDAIEIDATGKVVMPGFVDCATTLLSPPAALDDYETRCLKGTLPEPELAGGYSIPPRVKAMRAYSAQFLEMEGRRRLRFFWRGGTTTLDASSGLGLDEACELRTLRVLGGFQSRPLSIVRTYGGALAVAPEFSGRAEEYLEWMGREMLPLIRKRRLAEMVSIRVGEAGFPAEPARRFAGEAATHGLGVRLAVERGTMPDEIPSRMVSVTSDVPVSEVCKAAAGGAVVALQPATDFHAGRAGADARALIDGGAAVAIASGYGAGPTPSMAAVMSLACARSGLSPAEAITAATINPACALGVDHRCGSLETGKDADLLFIQTGDYRDIPLHLGLNLVAAVMKRGEMIFPRVGAA